jgi:hypothetical protein
MWQWRAYHYDTRAQSLWRRISRRAIELPSGAVVCVIVCVCRQQLACALIPIPKSSEFITEGGGKESQLKSIERGKPLPPLTFFLSVIFVCGAAQQRHDA